MPRSALEPVGWSQATVEETVRELAAQDRAAITPIQFGRRFFGGAEPAEVAAKAYGMFAHATRANLYPGFPAAKGMAFMQQEVIEHTLELLHAPSGASGLVTSGGTESVIMAAKAAVKRAAAGGMARGDMEILAANSAHPCIDKAAELLGVQLTRVPVGRDWRADPQALANAISRRTVMLFASFPSYPYGLADDIPALAALARDRGLWLHVDACMGGLLAPFMRRAGEHVDAFDFSVEGVCSVSVDLHKHGYAAKGASLVLFRSSDHARHAPFEYTEHPLPSMRTNTLAGTAAGAPIASAWAVMKHLGVEGFTTLAADLVRTRRAFLKSIRAVPGFEVLGEPSFSIVVVTSAAHDMRRVGEWLGSRQWFTLPVLDPPGLHLNLGAQDELLAAPFAEDLGRHQEYSH
jgi:sphinganine-1-phosphate aldolase